MIDHIDRGVTLAGLYHFQITPPPRLTTGLSPPVEPLSLCSRSIVAQGIAALGLFDLDVLYPESCKQGRGDVSCDHRI